MMNLGLLKHLKRDRSGDNVKILYSEISELRTQNVYSDINVNNNNICK